MFHKSNPAIGSRPGTLAIPAGSPPPRIFLTQYSKDGVLASGEISDPEDLARIDDGEGVVSWVDVKGLGDEAVLRRLGEIFALHPVVLENAVNVPQRAKCDAYGGHQLIIARLPMPRSNGPKVPPQVCFVLGHRHLITFQERPFGFFESVRERIGLGQGPIWQLGPDYLAYALLDTLVDHYYPIVEALVVELEQLEDEIADDPHPDVLAEVHSIRRQLNVIRRVGWPQREALNSLVRESSSFFSEEVRGYVRDTYDHMAQIVELVDAARDSASGLAEIYMSTVSHKTNEVMKVLTLMASIFIPLTFIAGIYGMNFENMPELHSRMGYFVVLGAMLVGAVSMIAYFRKRRWIGIPRRQRPPEGRRS